MRRLHLPRDFVIALLSGFTNQLAVPHELVPVNIAAFVNAHFDLAFRAFFLPLPLGGLPPNLPHSRIFRTNFSLPHFLIRACTPLRPIRLAAFRKSMFYIITYRLVGFERRFNRVTTNTYQLRYNAAHRERVVLEIQSAAAVPGADARFQNATRKRQTWQRIRTIRLT